jgi:hypothetical protein
MENAGWVPLLIIVPTEARSLADTIMEFEPIASSWIYSCNGFPASTPTWIEDFISSLTSWLD